MPLPQQAEQLDLSAPLSHDDFEPRTVESPAPASDAVAGGTPRSDPFTGGTTTPQASQPAAAPQTFRDIISTGMGYQHLPENLGDYESIAHLVSQANLARQLQDQLRKQDVYAQLGQQLAPRAKEIGSFLQQQQAPAAPVRQPWEPPKFDRALLPLLEFNEEAGVYIPKPGGDPEIARQANQAMEYHRKFQENPSSILEPMLAAREAELMKKVEERFQGHQAEQQLQASYQQIARDNDPWAYQRDGLGNRMVNPQTGQLMLTPAGTAYIQTVQQLRADGVTDPRRLDFLAKTILAPQYGEQAQAQTPQQQNPITDAQRRALGQAANRNALQQLASMDGGNNTNHAVDAPPGPGSLRDQMRLAFQNNGVGDASFPDLSQLQ